MSTLPPPTGEPIEGILPPPTGEPILSTQAEIITRNLANRKAPNPTMERFRQRAHDWEEQNKRERKSEPTIRENMEAKYGSVGAGVARGGLHVLGFIGMVFAAFIAAILNLARKS